MKDIADEAIKITKANAVKIILAVLLFGIGAGTYIYQVNKFSQDHIQIFKRLSSLECYMKFLAYGIQPPQSDPCK